MTDIFTSGVTLAAAGGAVYYLRSIPTYIWNRLKRKFVYTANVYETNELFHVLEQWLGKNYSRQYRDVEAILETTGEGINTKHTIKYLQEQTGYFITFHGKKLLVMKSKEKMDKAIAIKEMFFKKYVITGFRAKDAIEELFKTAIASYFEVKKINTLKVWSHGSSDWNYRREVKVKPIEKVIISKQDKQNLISDIEKFKESEDWYAERGIPYKRGYCFYGPPGTGKTTLALALANYLEKEVHVLNLAGIGTDTQLPFLFSAINENSMIIIEDIDNVFHGRESVNKENKINFSTLLNCMDGAFYKHGVILVITTNHFDKLDPALIRAGRIDLNLEVSRPSCTEISEYLSIFYEQEVEIIGKFDIPMSTVQEICMQNRDDLHAAKDALYGYKKTNGHIVHSPEAFKESIIVGSEHGGTHIIRGEDTEDRLLETRQNNWTW